MRVCNGEILPQLIPVRVEEIPKGAPDFSVTENGKLHIQPPQEFFPTDWQEQDFE